LAWTKYGLDQIRDNNVAFRLFDMLTNTRPKGVSQIVHPAIDEVMRNNKLYDEGFAALAAPQGYGVDAATIDRINQLDQLGLIRELQEALVNQRLAYVKTLHSYRHFRNGWIRRIEEFRPRSTPPEGWYR
jgi:lysozyme family protein